MSKMNQIWIVFSIVCGWSDDENFGSVFLMIHEKIDAQTKKQTVRESDIHKHIFSRKKLVKTSDFFCQERSKLTNEEVALILYSTWARTMQY